MIQELAPLHKHVCVALVGSNSLCADHGGGHEARQRQRKAIVASLCGTAWQVEAVVIDRL